MSCERVRVARGAGRALLVCLGLVFGPGPAVADVDEAGYRVGLARSVDVAVGEPRTLSLTLFPKPGFSLSREGPIRIALSTDGNGLRVRRQRLQRSDAADPAAEAPRFEIEAIGVEPGRHRLAVDLRFWLCRRHTCRPIEKRVDIEVRVVAPPDAGPPSSPDASP